MVMSFSLLFMGLVQIMVITRWELENVDHYTVKPFWYRVQEHNYFRVQEGILVVRSL